MPVDSEWSADIVVGVDFGMTCTGVAYSMAPEWPEPKQIQHWPGKMINELVNKVPTILGCNARTGAVETWGCLCDMEHDRDLDYQQLFKLNLDPEHRDPSAGYGPSVAQARQWFRDYLRCVHDHVRGHFNDRFPNWAAKRVEWVFSVPTSWTDARMINEIAECIRQSGFGGDGASHRVQIGLTEAEAAAVYAAKNHYQKGDVILVCDAGGGTTDVNVLKVDSGQLEPTRLTQLSWVEGKAIGSALIDFKVHTLIVDRLEKIRDQLSRDPEDIADVMLKGRFERWKCSFGSSASDFPTCELPILGLPLEASFPALAIHDGAMIIKRDELSRFFDEQVAAIFKLIDGQLQRIKATYPQEQIAYLVLSGGLGSSPYLKTRLRERYECKALEGASNTQKTRVLLSEEPQLAVVQGLVADRKNTMSGNVIFDKVCCRVSYGMLCKEKYNPKKHAGEDVFHDPRDNKKWALNQIDWFVDQGVSVPRSGVSRSYRLKLGDHDETAWKGSIVMSTRPRSERPSSMKWAEETGAAKSVCKVNAELGGMTLKEKNRHWYNFGPRYKRAEIDVRTVIGAADLRFQVWDKQGQMHSSAHDAIDVRWHKGEEEAEEPRQPER